MLLKYPVQLCTTIILWDSYYLREHLRIKHKMKMITYKNKVVNNYNENITGTLNFIQKSCLIFFTSQLTRPN